MIALNKLLMGLIPLAVALTSQADDFQIPVKMASDVKLSAPPISRAEVVVNAKNKAANDLLNFMADKESYLNPPASIAIPTAIDKVSVIQKKLKQSYKPVRKITSLKPGSSIMVPVAQGLMNRINTPFKMVAVRDSGSEHTIVDLDGGMVFITINTYEPMSLMVYEEGVPETMFSIMLQPIDAPPVMIDIDVELTPAMIAKRDTFHKEMEVEEKLIEANEMARYQTQTSEHVKRIKEILKPIAKGEIPRGFSYTEQIPVNYKTPCSFSIFHEAKQRLIGAREIVDVVLVKNNSQDVYSVREEHCISKDTIAVALLDKSILQPGQETEIYVLRDKLYHQRQNRVKRRSRLAK